MVARLKFSFGISVSAFAKKKKIIITPGGGAIEVFSQYCSVCFCRKEITPEGGAIEVLSQYCSICL
jgi:hypothetical protein